MRQETVDGVVVRVRDTGDHDRYLSVLTAEKGRISILSKGSHSLRSEQSAISQLYTYANFEYYRRGDFNILRGGSPIRTFYELSTDIDRLDLAAYLCDVAVELTDEGEEASEMLRMLLNSLHAIAGDLRPQEIIKGAFELRAAAMSGYEPELSGCSECGKPEAELFYLDVMNGSLLCPECLQKHGGKGKLPPPGSTYYDDLREAEILCPVSPSVTAALRYCVAAPLGRLFLFELHSEEERQSFSKAAETYLLSHLGRGFDSLNFYVTMRNAAKGAKAEHEGKRS